MKVRIVYNTAPIAEERIKTLASWRKIADRVEVAFTFSEDYRRSFIDKILYGMKLPNDPCAINSRLVSYQREDPADIVFIVKGVYIRPRTLKALKEMGAACVFWSNDDMWGWHNRNFWFNWSARHYNLVVTQKSYNCHKKELPSIGARVLFQDKAFDPAVHDRIPSTSLGCSHDVVFVGTCERDRYRSLSYLAKSGIQIHVYGWGAPQPSDAHPNLVFHDHHLYGHEYAEVFSGSGICLNFLRRQSRDLQTGRSVEIPACAGFMLAERTKEHLRLFQEGAEAEYFESDEELLRKTRFYLEHPQKAREIAEAGYWRTRNSDYSFDARMREIVENL